MANGIVPAFLGLFSDGPGKKLRATQITDENEIAVYIQSGSISDPSSQTIANVKPGGVLADPNNDSAVVMTLRETSSGVTIRPYGGSITQTIVSLAANTPAQLVGANSNRRGLRWMNVGANPFTAVPGDSTVTPQVGRGMNYNAASSNSQGYQGGSEAFEGTSISQNAFQAISAGGTTIVVWESF